MDHEGEVQLSKLKGFDSNIEIHDSLKTFSKEHVQLLINRRLKDIESDCLEDDLDKLQTFNLLSFFYFAVNKQTEALDYNNKARDIDGRNINALVCLAYYHLQWKDFFECEQLCQKLIKLPSTELEKIVARAEVAYAYTKIGITYFQKAVEIFQEILTQTIEIPDKYICSWKFSMALAMRRQKNISNCQSTTVNPATETNFSTVEKIYTDIISMHGNTCNRFKARACVDLGLEICYRREQIRQKSSTRFGQCESRKYIDKALELEPDDDFVLSRSGRYFRLIKQRTKAIELLTMALQKKETSFAHHQLALALRDQIKSSMGLCVSNRNTMSPIEQSHTNYPEDSFMRKLIKSPRKLSYFPREKTEEICHHLDLAVKLNNNISALYDKGLLLRSSRQYTEAVVVFKTIFGIGEKSCSELQLANAYEQAALCLLEEADIMPLKQQGNEYNAKNYLKKSITISCDMVARSPGLEGCWQSFPTLRSLLLDTAPTKQKLNELAVLHKQVEQYSAAIDIFQRVLQLEEEESERKHILIEIVDSNMQLERYDDAILVLNVIMCLPNGQEGMDKALYIRTHIKGGIAAFQTEETALAQKYLKRVVNTRMIWKHSSEEVYSTGEMSFDIFILSSEDSEEKARSVCDLLKQFGLKVTLNSDDVMFGQPEMEMIQTIMSKSEYIAVFLDKATEDNDIRKMQIMFTNDTSKSTIIISESERAFRNPIYSRYPSVPFERAMFSSVTYVTEEQVTWMETFLFTLTGVSPNNKT